jgi:hypothetical protein
MMDKSGTTSNENKEKADAKVPVRKRQHDVVVDSDSSAEESSNWNEAAATTTEMPTSSNSESLVESNITSDDERHPSRTKDSATEPSSPSSSIRSIIGNASIEISKLINENLIVARYVAILSVSSLGIYAFTQTPLFFRYRNVADIPSHYFYRRKTITGRLMIRHHPPVQNPPGSGSSTVHQNRSMAAQQSQLLMDDTAITCYIRHLSPIESLLSRKWLHRYWNLSHKLTAHSRILSMMNRDNKPEESISELIKVQIAGIQYPQLSIQNHSSSYSHGSSHRRNDGYNLINNDNKGTNHRTAAYGSDWIQRLSQQQCVVRCQFIERQVPNYEDANVTKQYIKNKRPIPGMTETTTNMIDSSIPLEDKLEHHVAIVKLYYHHPLHEHDTKNDNDDGLFPRIKNLFRRRLDLGESMIQHGYAVVAENGWYTTTPTTISTGTRMIDTTTSTTAARTSFALKNNSKQMQDDLRYMDRLSRAEYHAAQSYAGIWNDPTYRKERSDIMDEINFQQHSTMVQKFFRWIRGG